MGPSGCGKTTLIKLLQGHLHPNKGRVTVLGQNLAKMRNWRKISNSRRENLGLVFQQPRMIEELDAGTNVALGAAICGMNMNEALQRAHRLLNQCGVDPTQPVTTLSGGQLGRVGICRAVIAKPKLVLADEPSAALDPKTAHEMIDVLLEFSKAQGIVLITHDQSIAHKCDQILDLGKQVKEKI